MPELVDDLGRACVEERTEAHRGRFGLAVGQRIAQRQRQPPPGGLPLNLDRGTDLFSQVHLELRAPLREQREREGVRRPYERRSPDRGCEPVVHLGGPDRVFAGDAADIVREPEVHRIADADPGQLPRELQRPRLTEEVAGGPLRRRPEALGGRVADAGPDAVRPALAQLDQERH